MSKKELTEKDLTDAMCYDFSIQTTPQGKDFLILVCKDKDASSKLMDILRNNAFDVGIIINEKTGNYSLEFQFIDSQVGFRFDSGKSESSYPPLEKLKNNRIKFITTGIWNGRSEQGRLCEFDPGLMRLGIFDIGEAFKQADGVQFVAGESDKEPAVVVLTYKDYGHIFKAEADEAYNRLLDMSKGRPLLEISPTGPGKVNLRIWDILIDMDIQFDGLSYSEEQLREFTAHTGENNSFGFALGFSPKGKERAGLASTKRESFEIITLKGYQLNKQA